LRSQPQTATIGALSQGLGYVLMCWGGPYPLFVCAYLFVGFGLGLQVSLLELDLASTTFFPSSKLMC
jgi:hypothetical protein